MELTKCVSHQQTRQLLHNKFIVVVGDSIQRSVYKDLVLLLQKEKYLSFRQLRSKGEMSFEQDCLVEGGCLNEMHNGTGYREVRQYLSDHHLVRFYFVTRIYSCYMQSILEDFRHGLKPDVVIVNSCVWDISRHNSKWIDDYKENLCMFFGEMRGILPEDTLVVWNLAMPLGENIKGGFLVPEIEHKASHLRSDVIEANFYSGTLADAYGMDVLDLHFQFRFSLHHRAKDGIHWNALAHRWITSLLLHHIAQAWGVSLPCPLTAVDLHPPMGNYNSYSERFFSESLPFGCFDKDDPGARTHCHEAAQTWRPALPSVYSHQLRHGQVRNGFDYRPPRHFEPDREHRRRYVMRSGHTRRYYAPYSHHRPIHNAAYGQYY